MTGKNLGRTSRAESRVRGSESGITFMELLAVCVVISLLMMIIIPRIDLALRAGRRHAAAAQFTTAHAMARATAVRYSRASELHIDPDNGWFYVVVDTTLAGTGPKDTVGAIHRVGASDLTMTSTRTLLCFDRRGLASTTGACQAGDATVTFVSDGKADTVLTTTLGKILR
jgi:Tfp pilus assembly protein FimT